MSPGESCPSPSTAAERHWLGITALTSPRQVASASYTVQGWQGWQGWQRWTALPDSGLEILLDAGPGFPMAAVWMAEH